MPSSLSLSPPCLLPIENRRRREAPEGKLPRKTTILPESLEVSKVTVSFNCRYAGSVATGQPTLGQPNPQMIWRKLTLFNKQDNQTKSTIKSVGLGRGGKNDLKCSVLLIFLLCVPGQHFRVSCGFCPIAGSEATPGLLLEMPRTSLAPFPACFYLIPASVEWLTFDSSVCF